MFTSHNLICKINHNFCRKTMHSLKVLYYLSVCLSYKDCLGLFNVAKMQGLVFLLMAFAYYRFSSVQFSPVTQSCPTLSNPMDQSSLSITISQSLLKFMSSRLQSFPASGTFLMSQFFTSGGQSIGVSASASLFSVNIQD